jgi:hypothetical protein
MIDKSRELWREEEIIAYFRGEKNYFSLLNKSLYYTFEFIFKRFIIQLLSKILKIYIILLLSVILREYGQERIEKLG